MFKKSIILDIKILKNIEVSVGETQLRVNTGFTEDKCGLSPSMPAIAFSSSRPSSLRLLSVSCFLEKERAITAQSQVQTGKTSWIVITFN